MDTHVLGKQKPDPNIPMLQRRIQHSIRRRRCYAWWSVTFLCWSESPDEVTSLTDDHGLDSSRAARASAEQQCRPARQKHINGQGKGFPGRDRSQSLHLRCDSVSKQDRSVCRVAATRCVRKKTWVCELYRSVGGAAHQCVGLTVRQLADSRR